MPFIARAVAVSSLALASFLLPLAALAQTPALINYQGRLLNGTNLANGSIGLSLRLFDAGSGGTKLYEDSNTVTVADGLYATLLGDDSNFGNLQAALDNSNVWIEVAVNDNALTPRERLVAAAYAVKAQQAQGVASNAITEAMLADGAVTGAKLATGSVTTVALADGAVSGTKIASNTITTANVVDGGLQAQDFATVLRLAGSLTITNPSASSGDQFGGAVAGVGADRIIVGAPFDDGTVINGGRAYLYDLNGGTQAVFSIVSGSSYDFFGTSVSALGTNRVVIGAPGYSITFTSSVGRAYVYNLAGSLAFTITNPTPAASDTFGDAVAGLGTNRIAVAAPGDDTGATNAGCVYLYSGSGSLLATVTNPTPAADDAFGSSLAAIGTNRFAVGVPADDTGAANAGTVYLYDQNGGLQLTITNPAPASNEGFGSAVAGIGTNRIVIGAPQDAGNVGRAYVYDLNGGLLLTITNPLPTSGDQFGVSVAAVGTNALVVGASLEDVGAPNTGVAHIFDLNGVLLVTITNPTPVNSDNFGLSVAGLDPGRLVVGASGDDTGATDAGSVYLYDLAGQSWVVPGLAADGVAPGVVGVDQLETSSVDARYLLKAGDTVAGSLTVTGALLGSPPYIKVAETQVVGTAAGANVAGTNNFRTLNAELADTHGLATLSGGDVTLPAGTYYCRISAPAYRVDENQARLRTSTGTVLLYGTSTYSDNTLSPSVQVCSLIDGQFTLASTATLQIQHYMKTVRSPNGLGVPAAATWGDGAPYEVYTVAEFWKIK